MDGNKKAEQGMMGMMGGMADIMKQVGSLDMQKIKTESDQLIKRVENIERIVYATYKLTQEIRKEQEGKRL